MFRILKAFGLAIGGFFSGWRKKINKHHLVVQATFEEAANKAEGSRTALRAGLSEKMRIVESKKKEIEKLQEQLDGERGLRRTLVGVEIAIKNRGEAIRAKNGGVLTPELVKNDSQPKTGLIALRIEHEAKKARINEIEQRISKLEKETASSDADIARHEANLGKLKDQARNLREEGATRVADLIANKAERQLNDQLSGYSVDSDDEQLAEVRRLCEADSIETGISRRLAAAEGPNADDDFLALAESQSAGNDFDALLDMTSATPVSTPAAPEKLPE